MNPTRRQVLLASCATVALVPLSAHARSFLRVGGASAGGGLSQSISTISLSKDTFVTGSPTGTTVGIVTVILAPSSPGPTGTLVLSGSPLTSNFTLSGSGTTYVLATSGSVTGGPFSGNIIYTQAGLMGSPFTLPVTITIVASLFPTTTVFVNDGATTVTGGAPTQSIGHIFRGDYKGITTGDIPPGHAPRFTDSSSRVWTYSAGLQTYWPDGSLRFAAFILMPPAGVSITAGGSITLTVSDGGFGSWPANSSRSLTEVYNQQIVVNAPLLSSPSNGRSGSGTISAWLLGDGNNYEVTKDMDGAAGARWRIKTKMASTQGGTADGALVCDHYVQALNNLSGALGGFRWMGMIRQPFYQQAVQDLSFIFFEPPNTGSPAAGLNWSINPGGSGVVHAPVPWGTYGGSFGWTNGGVFNASITGSTLTINSVTSGALGSGGTATGTLVPVGSNGATLTISTNLPPNAGTTTQFIPIYGPGIPPRSFLTSVNSGTTYGQPGSYGLYNPPALGFTPVSSPSTFFFPTIIGVQGGNGQLLLYDGATLTGQYAITGQLSGTPGGVGTYSITGTLGSPISSEAMTIYAPVGGTVAFTSPNANYCKYDYTQPVILNGGSLPPVSGSSGNQCSMTDGGLSFVGNSWPQQFALAFQPAAPGFAEWTFTGPGGGTLTQVPAISPFSRLAFADSNAKYNFFQGTGSISTETTLRVQINQHYWQSVGMIPPPDLTIQGASMVMGGLVVDQGQFYLDVPANLGPTTWTPYSIGGMPVSSDDTGDSAWIGVLHNDAICDFYNQSEGSDRLMRFDGMSVAGVAGHDMKDDANDRNLNLINPYGTSTYTGLPNSVSTSPGGTADPAVNPGVQQATGYSPVPGIQGQTTGSIADSSHPPNYAYWTYLRTGERQYLDMTVDLAIGYIVGNPSRNTTVPYFSYGNNSTYAIQTRAIAWTNACLGCMAMLYPNDPSGNVNNPVFSDGTQLAKYLNDLANQNSKLPLDTLSNTYASAVYGSQAAYVQSRGLWHPFQASLSGVRSYLVSQPWAQAHIAMSVCLNVVRGDPNAVLFLQTFAQRWQYIVEHYSGLTGGTAGLWHLYWGATLGECITNISTGITSLMIGSDAQWGVAAQNAPDVSWTPTTPAFTFTPGGGFSGLPPLLANGDRFNNFQDIPPRNYMPAELSGQGPYYVIDVSAPFGSENQQTFDLSLTLGGSRLNVTSTGNGNAATGFWSPYVASTIPPNYTLSHYTFEHHNPWAWGNALGVSGFSGFLADVEYRLENNCVPGSEECVTPPLAKAAYQGNGMFSDARYCVANTLTTT